MLLDGLGAAPACLVTVESTQGSVPREPGAWMAVFADQLVGTIGGGHLELQAITEARRRLAGGSVTAPGPMRFALGPALGQCCGGVVHLGLSCSRRKTPRGWPSDWRPDCIQWPCLAAGM